MRLLSAAPVSFFAPLITADVLSLTILNNIVEWVGYIGRAWSAKQTPDWTLTPYIIQSVLLLVAPALFAASIYMELGRIILLLDGDKQSIIRRTWLTKLFVLGDISSFMVQSTGTDFHNFNR